MNAPIDLTGVCLETDRLVLRTWQPGDLGDLYEYAQVDGVGQMAGWKPHTSIEESRAILSRFIESRDTFALELKETGKVVGSLGIEPLSIPLPPAYDDMAGRELGYVLGKAQWGRGLMTEAVGRAIAFCFEEAGCRLLLCGHFVENPRSRRVIEKSGFRYLRTGSVTLSDGVPHEELFYLLEREDWLRLPPAHP